MKKLFLLAVFALFLAGVLAPVASAKPAPVLKKAVITEIGNNASGEMYTPAGGNNIIYGNTVYLTVKFVGQPSQTSSFLYQYGSLIGQVSKFVKSASYYSTGATITCAIPFSSLPTGSDLGTFTIKARGYNGGTAEAAVYGLKKAAINPRAPSALKNILF